MKKEDCFQLLGLPESSSESEIKKKYTELFNDYQLRLTNAPTPNLKKLYQKNIQELNDALDVLLEGGAEGVNKDLPSSSPVFENKKPGDTSGFIQKEGSGRKETSGTPTAKTKAADAKTEAALTKYKKLFNILLISSVVALSGIAILAIVLTEKNSTISDLEKVSTQFDSLSVENEELTQKLQPFQNGKMKIKNLGGDNLKVNWVIVMYKDKDGNLVKFEDNIDKIIRAGSTEEINKLSGASYVWDGSVISYACELQYQGSKYWQSGLWSEDSENGNLVLNLGNL
jgi:hypothetical protein